MSAPLLVTDRGSANLPFVSDILESLRGAGLSPGHFSGISPNPLDSDIAAGCQAFAEGGHDGIIGLGGGSGMDGAKAICLTARSGLDLWDFEFSAALPEAPREAFPPLILIPTTAGTGAESESTAMVTDSAKGMKFCIWHPNLKPAAALLDPSLTLGLPKELTAWTGCDALVHAIEGYCVPSFHPLCDGAALEALRLIARWLPQVDAQGENLEARGAMLVGSCLAGVSFIKGLGLVHSISHMVGAEFNSHHGLTNAICLPAVLRYNAPAIEAKTPIMAEAMGLQDRSFEGFYSAVCTLLDQLNIPKSLKEIGIPKDCAARIAEKAYQDSATATNPRSTSVDEIKELVDICLEKAR